jgi:hypothetical protein
MSTKNPIYCITHKDKKITVIDFKDDVISLEIDYRGHYFILDYYTEVKREKFQVSNDPDIDDELTDYHALVSLKELLDVYGDVIEISQDEIFEIEEHYKDCWYLDGEFNFL